MKGFTIWMGTGRMELEQEGFNVKEMENFKRDMEVRELLREFIDHTMLRITAQNLVGAGWTPEDEDELRERHFADAKEKAEEIGYELTEDDLCEVSEGFNVFMKEIKKACNEY